uniref:Uncharacterized protein n=1 Tax=Physcomitrium patens TaxID=3218 RepID=A0A2K1KWD4_PHYPA|nr:hypothetical protein PHYPA_005102 [Physcomitrium patens]
MFSYNDIVLLNNVKYSSLHLSGQLGFLEDGYENQELSVIILSHFTSYQLNTFVTSEQKATRSCPHCCSGALATFMKWAEHGGL